jgi:mycoredoxin
MDESFPKIALYVRPWCGGSVVVKRWLDERGIPYTEIDISQDRDAARYVEGLNGGYQSVPTILFDGVHVATEPSTGELERILARYQRSATG